MTEGVAHAIEGRHIEHNGRDFFTVSVELEQSDIIGHPHAMKEIQYVEVRSNATFERTQLEINKVDSGKFKVVFMHPTTLKPNATKDYISMNATAAELRDAIKGYYQYAAASDIDVTRTMFGSNGTETDNATLCTKSIYNITLKRLISGTSASSILTTKTGSTATITVRMPSEVQTSGAPLTGKFRIQCKNAHNHASLSDPIPVGAHPITVEHIVQRSCAKLNDKIQVWQSNEFAYPQNGFGFFIRYAGKNEDVGQAEIQSDTDQPLAGEGISYYANTTVPYSNNLFYEPVPFEWLRTYETKPQLIVTVNGEPAVCHNLTCDFVYTEPQGEVTGFTYEATTKVVALTGTGLIGPGIRYIEFAKSRCAVDPATMTETSLTCTLVQEPTCGDHVPLLTSTLGLVNTTTGLTPETITCLVSSVAPTTQLNLLGQDNLTISGTFFPYNLVTSTVSINFTDAASTPCIPQWSDSSELVCLTQAFDAAEAGSTLGMTITINGQVVTNTLSLPLMGDTKSGVSIEPSSASPVLKTKINITLEDAFPYTLAKEDFTVNATNISNPEYFR